MERLLDPPECSLSARHVSSFLKDLESLADSWNALAVTYRLWPDAVITTLHHQADVLEGAADQLARRVQRFREAGYE